MRRNPKEYFLIPLIDFLGLLFVAFFGVAALSAHLVPENSSTEGLEEATKRVTESAADVARLQQEKNFLLQKLQAVHQRAAGTAQGLNLDDQIQELRKAITGYQEKIENLLTLASSLTLSLEQLKSRLANFQVRKQQLEEIAADLRERTAELEELEKEKKKETRRLAEVQAALAQAGKGKYALKTGAPMVRPDKVARLGYLLALSEGKVIPVADPYYTAGRRSDGGIVAWPVKPGLTIQEALQPNSPVMKQVLTGEFRREGRVKMIVNPDSFDTFRALRDALLEQGIDYGWEPYQGTQIVFSDGGREIASQKVR